MTWNAIRHLSDERLFKDRATQADTCVRILAMPAEEADKPGPKGEASPREAAAFNAMIAFMLDAEIKRRGLE